ARPWPSRTIRACRLRRAVYFPAPTSSKQSSRRSSTTTRDACRHGCEVGSTLSCAQLVQGVAAPSAHGGGRRAAPATTVVEERWGSAGTAHLVAIHVVCGPALSQLGRAH